MQNSVKQILSTCKVIKDGERLDKWLVSNLSGISRSRFKALIESGNVKNEDVAITDPSYKIKKGQAFTVEIHEAVEADPEPQDIPLEVLFEDEHLIVVNKPASMVVHPAPGNYDGTLVNALLFHCKDNLSGIGGVKRPGIVHRLDKDTSGIMVVAKSDIVHKGLSVQFAEHSLERKYKAVVWGIPKPIKGTVERRIGRSPFDRKKMAVLKKGGRDAITHYKLIKTLGTYASLIECKLETGRTHQIRVHMTSKGHSLVNDPVYGGDRKAFTAKISKDERQLMKNCIGQALHAYLLGFTHPVTNEYLRFENKIPEAMKALIKMLEKY